MLSPPYSLEDQYSSKIVRSHYSERKQKAIAFLFTIGAKALVLAENDFNDSNCGLNEEANLKKDILYDENVRIIKRNIAEKKEIEVQKLSKKGVCRKMFLKIRKNKQHNGVLIWKSSFKHTKRFILDSKLSVQLMNSKFEYSSLFPTEHNPASTNSDSKLDHGSITAKDLIHEFCNQILVNSKNVVMPTIRFQNSVRYIDIQFQTLQEMEACLQIIQMCQPDITFTA